MTQREPGPNDRIQQRVALWKRVEDVYFAALDLEEKDRNAFLDRACGADEDLRREVESLLSYESGSAQFMETPAFEVTAEALADESRIAEEGRHFGPYKIVSFHGAGGMGEVYLAHDSRLGRNVALKLLPRRWNQETEWNRRFEQEARAASALNHPNILTIYDIGIANDVRYMASEFIEGQTLRRLMADSPMELSVTLDIAIQVASALAAAHEAGIVHRDLKPENVMIRQDGLVKLLDFGLAKLIEAPPEPPAVKTETGAVMGTTRYMSPEQARGEPADTRSDLFALGVMIYEMLAGVPPFLGETNADIIASLLLTEPHPLRELVPDLPPALQSIMDQLLRKTREDRYPSAKQLAVDLKTVRRNIELQQVAPAQASSEANVTDSAGAGRSTNIVVAVLPFKPINAEQRDEYLELGMADALITRLSEITRLILRPVSAVRRYTRLDQDPVKAGRDLKVESVLDGTIQKHGDRIRVTARLVRVKDGRSLWTGKFDEKSTDIFAVEDSISEKLAAALVLRLTDDEREHLAKRYTDNTQAYHLYLKGRFYWNKRSPAPLYESIKYYKQAIELDPNYALAYAGLGDSYTFLGDAGITAIPPREAFSKGTAAAERALEIDETLAEAHTCLGHLNMHHFRWLEAQKQFGRSLQLKPNYATTHEWYAYYFLLTGRPEDALVEIRCAQDLDPLSVPIHADVGDILYFSRRYDPAIEHLRKLLQADPHYYRARLYLARAYEQKHMFHEAVEEYQKAVESSARSMETLTSLARGYILAGRMREAEAALAELEELSKTKYISPYDQALIHAALEKKDRALQFLEEALEENSGWIIFLGLDPRLDGLRGEPRFQNLQQHIGLPTGGS